MKRFVLLLLFAIFIQNLPAQNGGLISGTVTEKSSGRTLPGAMLMLDKLNRYTISDKNGYFEFLSEIIRLKSPIWDTLPRSNRLL